MTVRSLRKGAFSLLLLTLALALMWYAMCTGHIALSDRGFAMQRASAGLFPEALLLKGNLAYYDQLDASVAAASFRRAISMQPLLVEAWLALVRVELAQGRTQEARGILDKLAPLIAHVSTWKWQELLLAYKLKNDSHFADCFNFILGRLPERAPEAWYLALDFWGNWAGISPHVAPPGRVAYLHQLMKEKEADVALSLWRTMEADADPPPRTLALLFCQFLMDNNRWREAKEFWKDWKEGEVSRVTDGSFEHEPANAAFGWRFTCSPEVEIERTAEAPFVGGYCLHLHFGGTSNVNFNHVSQIIPVEPGRTYMLRFAQKSRDLTTDQGIFLEVTGYQCGALRVQTRPVTGTLVWTREEIELPVPADCEAVCLQVRRKDSLRFDSKISGDYWLDGVELSLRDQS